jgi:predicted GIY-YIG superfamily endonuclease
MEERTYFTYIVASRSHTLYIGMTGNLLKRVFEHKQKSTKAFLQLITATGWPGLNGLALQKVRLSAKSS